MKNIVKDWYLQLDDIIANPLARGSWLFGILTICLIITSILMLIDKFIPFAQNLPNWMK
jgi:hypothetical protein